jgi:hypothetical protein
MTNAQIDTYLKNFFFVLTVQSTNRPMDEWTDGQSDKRTSRKTDADKHS